MYIALRAEADSPQRTKFLCQQKGLITLPVASFKEISLKSDFIHFFFHDLIHVYSPRAARHIAPRG